MQDSAFTNDLGGTGGGDLARAHSALPGVQLAPSLTSLTSLDENEDRRLKLALLVRGAVTLSKQ